MPARLPTELLELSGTKQLQPVRYSDRADEPRDTPLLDADNVPFFLSPEEKTVWIDIVKNCHKGVLKESDGWLLIGAAKVVAAVAFFDGCPPEKTLTVMLQYLSRLGMTPVDSSKVSAPRKAEATPAYAKFGQPRLVP